MFPRRKILLACCLSAVLIACAGPPGRTVRVDPEPVDEAPLPSVPVAASPSSETGAEALAAVVVLLEDGRFDEARARLESRLKDRPDDRAARRLLGQLTADPQALLGPPAVEHTVMAGESLSLLAGRYLGDPLLFAILARYNGIAQPRRLEIGQRIAIPQRRPDALVAPRENALVSSETELVSAQAFRRAIEDELNAGRPADAIVLVARARARAPAVERWADWLDPLERRGNALLWQQRGLDGLASSALDDRERALEAFERALALEPGLEPARSRRAEARGLLVADYHRSAVVHFRNQRLDEALALWERALALDPEFEPALGYRIRAQELKRRLDDLEREDEPR